MKTLMRILRSRRGDLLVDGMIGAAVVGMIFAATSAGLLMAGQISINNSNNTARSLSLYTQLAEMAPNAGSIPGTGSPALTTTTIKNRDVTAAVWREETDGAMFLYARTARFNNKNPEVCLTSVADDGEQTGCLLATWLDPATAGGIKVDPFAMTEGTHPVLLETSPPIPAGTGEARYLFTVVDAPADSTLTFTASATGGSFTVDVPAGRTGNYYGSLRLPVEETNVTVSTTGPATFDTQSFLLYGAPQP